MSADLFTRLARRAIGERPVVQPRVDPLLEQPPTEHALSMPAGDPNPSVTDTNRGESIDLAEVERPAVTGVGPAAVGERVAERSLQPRPDVTIAAATTLGTPNQSSSSEVVPHAIVATESGDAAVHPPRAARRARSVGERGPVATIALPVAILPAPDPPLPTTAADQRRGDDRAVAPVIDITIDRIEVRTERQVRDHGRPDPPRSAGEPKPALPLADYLAQRGR